MKRRKIMIKYSITAFALLASFAVNAQDSDSLNSDPNLQKTVHVITEYEPSISDANRINNLPQLEDTLTVKPTFKYSIVSKPIHPIFEVTPINAAKMKGEPLTRLYRGIFTGALGNYMSTLANLQLTSIRSKKVFISSEFNHQGAFNDVKDGGKKVPSTYSDNFAKISAKRFIENKVIYGEIGGKYDMYHAYGNQPFSSNVYTRKEIQKQYTWANVSVGLKTLYLDSGKFNYDIKPFFALFNAKSETETNAGLDAELEKLFGEQAISGLAKVEYHGNNGDIMAPTTEIMLNPFASMTSDKLSGKVGFSTQLFMGGFEKFYLHPDVYAEYKLADNIFTPYIACNGKSMWSGMDKLVAENPYITEGIYIKPENTKINVTGGVKGLLTNFVPYNLSASYSQIENMHMFVANSGSADNSYSVICDTANVFNFHSELGFKKLEKINMTFKFDYFSYAMKNQTKAWQKPSLITTLNLRYNLQNKIVVNFDVFYVGDRDALDIATSTETKAKGFVDVNLGVEYRYTKRLSGFVNLNNIAAQNYQYWSYTPVQRFNALFGFSYSFWGE